MAKSLLGSFVGGTRQMLAAQLFISIGAVALAGWTLSVTTELIRERDRLRERVIQLEETMAGSGVTVPAAPARVDAAPQTPPAGAAYPPSAPPPDRVIEEPAPQPEPTPAPGHETPPLTRAPVQPAPVQPEPAPAEPPRTEPAPPRAETPAPAFDPGQILADLFAPAPPVRLVVLHARNRTDAVAAQRIAREMAAGAEIQVLVDVMAAGDQRASGYAYFDGRQSRAAASLVARFNDTARRYEIAPWSAQLRGVALPAQGEYTADRVDIVLPPLPPPTPPLQIDPRVLRQVQPQPQVAPQPAPTPIR